VLPTLNNEYSFWVKNRSVIIQMEQDVHGDKKFKLIDEGANNQEIYEHLLQKASPRTQAFIVNRYDVDNILPRPESYSEDIHAAGGFGTEAAKEAFYGELASGAETGWDFSSRWFAHKKNYTTIRTKFVIPVDLNSILYMNEEVLRSWNLIAGNKQQAMYFQQQATQRRQAIQALFWNATALQWYDFLLDTLNGTSDGYFQQHNDPHFYPSNFVPLYALAFESNNETMMNMFKLFQDKNHPFHYPAGVPTSQHNTTQQWDFPNGWAPLQYFIIEGLTKMHQRFRIDTRSYTNDLIERWITTNYCAWNNTGGANGGMMFEKYDVTQIGKAGGGGEYVVQAGFGWTNGVILHFLKDYGATLKLREC